MEKLFFAAAAAAAEEENNQDHFDRLPDAIILDIFNKLLDAKSLTRCLSVCKRFSSLIPQVNSVFLSVPRREPTSKPNYGFILNSLRIIFGFRKLVTKPLKRFRRATIHAKPAVGKGSSGGLCPPPLMKVLRNFREVKSMHVELQLPLCGGGIGSDDGDCFIKWRAEFGRELKSCIILGATCFHRRNPIWESSDEGGGEEEEEEQFLTDDQLKLRIIWTISCLISASARHHFVKQNVSDYPRLQNVVISDCNNQGKLWMGEEQLAEVRSSLEILQPKPLLERTQVPDLNIKMSYLPVLELPASGYTMKGATLVVIRPDDDGMTGMEIDGCDFDGEGEEKVFGEAVREMMKVKKSYVMTMNSF